MASEKQIAANRANSRKSNGPTFAADRSKSLLNATRDGLHARPRFENLKARHIADLSPQTADERQFVEALAWDTWCLNRVTTDLANTDADPKRFALLNLYAKRLHCKLHRVRTALLQLHTDRKTVPIFAGTSESQTEHAKDITPPNARHSGPKWVCSCE
jgi:hypothetical protein